MPSGDSKKKLHLGFLAALEVKDRGYVGGLLVTNHYGRPLEFQCTAPIRPNNTQEMLYGPTLVPYLYNELIGKTLIEKAGVKPDLVLAEDERILALREHIPHALACLDSNGTVGSGTSLGRQSLRLHERFNSDETTVQAFQELVTDEVDLFEPFDRIRQALHEALQNKQRA